MKIYNRYQPFFIAIGIALISTTIQAEEEQFWEHKDWRSFTEFNDKGEMRCMAMGGEEGGNTFVVAADKTGNVWFYYQEMTVRGIQPNLSEADTIMFRIEGKQPMDYEDVMVSIGVDEEGIPEAKASMPDGYAAEFIGKMKASDSLSILRENPANQSQEVLQKFSLSGFTANLLKIAEWCRFDANQIRTP